MKLSQSIFLTAIASLAASTTAYTTNEAFQLNFYSDTKCTKYIGESDHAWPYLDADPSFPQDTCFTFAQPSGTVSLNLAGAYRYDSSTPVPAYCTLYTGGSCDGSEQAKLVFGQSKGTDCEPTRSPLGHYLWKSARCYFS
ncbi:hypothetical protein GGI43DRAFT_409170 [Trichoderma evansii]